ncbi:hypothetical protein P5G51_007455 [Virgibacillus sp. 179-BFC.A HS]|uniref:Transposase n=1 Tax=Tigheibacillus jepli TaxID=3035914 RepID=A0ABU5CG17_9BACI|nr:hypothetical protein [Virgibacillus sp. 179-BFC.A HS]MDY0405262.1 hypothetical protein [Virgibacillus sp. 179-BFC.A HS]
MLRQLLLSLGFKPKINAFLVFINPSFTLYQAPLDKPFIFPNQIERHIKTLNATLSKLTEKHKIVADQLLSLNITDSSFKQIPAYEYDQLKKGISCPQCHTLNVAVVKRQCVCRKCGYIESTTDAVLRSINEYKTLFPNEKITTKTVYDWCRVIPSKKIIRNILANNFKVISNNKWSYYE